LSSYNTASDTVEDPNVRALNAIFADLPQRFAVDMHRIYLAGFSGTARLAWGYADQIPDHVAGILAFSAGLPWSGVDAWMHLRKRTSFVWFGGAGTDDFNYDAVRSLDAQLDSLAAVRHRVEFYPGPHAWAPEPVCSDGVDWMELQAMTVGLEPRNDSAINVWYEKRVAVARAAEDSGALYDAYVEYRGIRDDFRTLHDVSDVSGRVVTLSRQPAIRREAQRRQDLTLAYDAYRSDTLMPFLASFAKSRHPPPLEKSLHVLGIPELLQRSRDSTDLLRAGEARRALAVVVVSTAFYGPRTYFAAKDATRALALLAIAQVIAPSTVDVCFGMAAAYAMLDRRSEALGSLECAVRSGRLSIADVRGEPAFDGLRADSAFLRTVAPLQTTASDTTK
jgi:dienelactone hydrolase